MTDASSTERARDALQINRPPPVQPGTPAARWRDVHETQVINLDSFGQQFLAEWFGQESTGQAHEVGAVRVRRFPQPVPKPAADSRGRCNTDHVFGV